MEPRTKDQGADCAVADILSELSAGAIHLYETLDGLSQQKGFAWPSAAFLAAKLCRSERTIRRHLQELREAGLIRVERHKPVQCHFFINSEILINDHGAVIDDHGAVIDDHGAVMDGQQNGQTWPTERPNVANRTAKDDRATLEYREQDIQQQPGAAAAPAPQEENDTGKVIKDLEAIGMPETVKPAAEKDPSLAAAVLDHCQWRFKSRKMRPIASQAGYITNCFRSPFRYGFTRSGDEWSVPAGQPGKAATPRGMADREAEIARKREEEARRNAERLDAETRRLDAWNARPEPVKNRVRAIVRARQPLFASDNDDFFPFRSRCVSMAEEMEARGEL